MIKLGFELCYVLVTGAEDLNKAETLLLDETRVWSLGREDALEEGMATHLSTLA